MKLTKYFLLLLSSFLYSYNLIAGSYFIASCKFFRKAKRNDNITDIEKYAVVHYLEEQYKIANQENRNNYTKYFVKLRNSYNKKACELLDDWVNSTKDLDLSYNNNQFVYKIINLKPLSEFSGMTSLKLNGHSIEDLKFIEDLSNLQSLHLSHNSINENSIRYLKQLSNLKYLDISHNEFSNIDDLLGLNKLETFIVSNNEITTVDMRKISSLTNLSTFDLEDNKLTDLYGMSPRKYPITIEIKGNSIQKKPLKYPEINFSPPFHAISKIAEDDKQNHYRSLINKGQYEDLETQDFVKSTVTFEDYYYALIGAISKCNEKNFSYLRSNFKGSKFGLYRFKSYSDLTPLHVLAEADPQNKEEMKSCIYIASKILRHGRGSLVNHKGRYLTPLDMAVIKRSIPLIKYFLSADPNKETLDTVKYYSKDKGLTEINKLIIETINGSPPTDFDDIESEFELSKNRLIAELYKSKFSPVYTEFLNMLCCKVESIEACVDRHDIQISGFSQREVSYLSVYQDFKNTHHLTKEERDKIKRFSRSYGEKLFSSIQGSIISYFIASAMIESEKFSIEDSVIDNSLSTNMIGVMKNAFRISDKIVPSLGILPGISAVLNLGYKKLKKSDKNKTRQKYGKVNQLGDGNLLNQMREAKLTTLALLEYLFKYRLMPDTDQKYEKIKKLFRKYYELTIFEIALDDNINNENRPELIGAKVGQSIESHKNPEKLNRIFRKIPEIIKAALAKVGGLDRYATDKISEKIKNYLAESDE